MMEGILWGIPNVCVYIDDILVTGASDEEHLKTLDEVLTRLETAGLKLKQKKCAFLLDVIKYLATTFQQWDCAPHRRISKQLPRPQHHRM